MQRSANSGPAGKVKAAAKPSILGHGRRQAPKRYQALGRFHPASHEEICVDSGE